MKISLPDKLNEKGALPLVVVAVGIAIIAFMAVASTFPLKDNLFGMLYPKAASNASESISGPVSGPVSPSPTIRPTASPTPASSAKAKPTHKPKPTQGPKGKP